MIGIWLLKNNRNEYLFYIAHFLTWKFEMTTFFSDWYYLSIRNIKLIESDLLDCELSTLFGD